MTGRRRPRALNDDERALWETVTRAIAPLKRRKPKHAEEGRDETPGSAGPARPQPSSAVTPAIPSPPPRAEPPPLAPLGRRMKQKLARGTEEIDARIDLHGMTQSAAHAALMRFLVRAQRDGARVVLVITGKGARPSEDPHAPRGVLKRQVPMWLEGEDFRSLVIGFEGASIGHGGQGALYVRVRRVR